MARKWKPSSETVFQFENIADSLKIIWLALQAADSLGWRVEHVSYTEAVFGTPVSWLSYGEKIVFRVETADDGKARVSSSLSVFQFTDYGRNRKNLKRLEEEMRKLQAALPEEEQDRGVEALRLAINESVSDGDTVSVFSRKGGIWSLLIPGKEFMATPVLLDINVLVFVLMVVFGVGFFEPDTLGLLHWGANSGMLTLTGDWWRTFTCNFIHIGVMHLLMNMYALLYIGLYLEPLLKVRRMLVAYVLTGLCSAAASLVVHPDVTSAGASGSIFGLYGVFLAYLLFHKIDRVERKALLTSMILFVAYNLMYGFAHAGIDNAAHIGGLISGFLLGLAYVESDRVENRDLRRIWRYMSEGVLLVLVSGVLINEMRHVPDDYTELRRMWQEGILQKYFAGEITEEELMGSMEATVETDEANLPLVLFMNEHTSWKTFEDKEMGFSCVYPDNWTLTSPEEGMLMSLSNGMNTLEIVYESFESQEDFFYNSIHNVMGYGRDTYGKLEEGFTESVRRVDEKIMRCVSCKQWFVYTDKGGFYATRSVLFYEDINALKCFACIVVCKDEGLEPELERIISSFRLK